MPLDNGAVFAGYSIQRLLGSGGMGEVYLAQHPRLPRLDALKILPASLTEDVDYRQRFNREADLAATLWHPHIVGLHDRGEFEGQLWITMDYVDGTDAAHALRDGVSEAEALEIVTAVADALDYAHQRNLVHRDVKPANILLTKSDADRRRILLADFGIARQADDISGLTATNMTVGSIAYAAPEQLMGEPIDGRADQYALAATAFHMLAGAPPFQHSNAAVIIGKHLTAPPPPLAQHRPDLARLDPVLSKAMAKDPAQRYPRCLDFAQALGAALSGPAAHGQPTQAAVAWPPVTGAPVPAPLPPGPPIPYHPAPVTGRRRTWPAIVVPLVLAVLLLGASAFATTQVMRPSARPSIAAAPLWQPYVDYGRQFGVWLTTISADSLDGDIQRVLDGSTGEFHDEFAKTSATYTQLIRNLHSNNKATAQSAALESIDGSTAQVLVAVVTTHTGEGSPQKETHSRFRMQVEKVGDGYKVSKAQAVT
jgi:serine/threonine protein kinase, bacterial